MKNLVLSLAVALCITLTAFAAGASSTPDAENTIYLDLKYGRVVIMLRPDLAPGHVARIKELTRQGFYNGLVFHRVIDGFMAQTGDPEGTGRGGSGQKLRAEFSDANFGRGTVGMARAQDLDSGDSQFFICFKDCSFLNGQYTVWGQVTSGMDFVDQIVRGEPPVMPDTIVKMQIAADADKPAPAPAPLTDE